MPVGKAQSMVDIITLPTMVGSIPSKYNSFSTMVGSIPSKYNSFITGHAFMEGVQNTNPPVIGQIQI